MRRAARPVGRREAPDTVDRRRYMPAGVMNRRHAPVLHHRDAESAPVSRTARFGRVGRWLMRTGLAHSGIIAGAPRQPHALAAVRSGASLGRPAPGGPKALPSGNPSGRTAVGLMPDRRSRRRMGDSPARRAISRLRHSSHGGSNPAKMMRQPMNARPGAPAPRWLGVRVARRAGADILVRGGDRPDSSTRGSFVPNRATAVSPTATPRRDERRVARATGIASHRPRRCVPARG